MNAARQLLYTKSFPTAGLAASLHQEKSGHRYEFICSSYIEIVIRMSVYNNIEIEMETKANNIYV